MKVIEKIMKVLKSNQALLFLLALVVAGFAIHNAGALKNAVSSGFQNEVHESRVNVNTGPVGAGSDLDDNDINASEVNDNTMGALMENPSDLLPKVQGENNQDFNAAAGNFLNNENLVSTFQIPTQSQVLRNANLQLRSEPPNPQESVCPWMQSTIQPDLYRKPLE